MECMYVKYAMYVHVLMCIHPHRHSLVRIEWVVLGEDPAARSYLALIPAATFQLTLASLKKQSAPRWFSIHVCLSMFVHTHIYIDTNFIVFLVCEAICDNHMYAEVSGCLAFILTETSMNLVAEVYGCCDFYFFILVVRMSSKMSVSLSMQAHTSEYLDTYIHIYTYIYVYIYIYIYWYYCVYTHSCMRCWYLLRIMCMRSSPDDRFFFFIQCSSTNHSHLRWYYLIAMGFEANRYTFKRSVPN